MVQGQPSSEIHSIPKSESNLLKPQEEIRPPESTPGPAEQAMIGRIKKGGNPDDVVANLAKPVSNGKEAAKGGDFTEPEQRAMNILFSPMEKNVLNFPDKFNEVTKEQALKLIDDLNTKDKAEDAALTLKTLLRFDTGSLNAGDTVEVYEAGNIWRKTKQSLVERARLQVIRGFLSSNGITDRLQRMVLTDDDLSQAFADFLSRDLSRLSDQNGNARLFADQANDVVLDIFKNATDVRLVALVGQSEDNEERVVADAIRQLLKGNLERSTKYSRLKGVFLSGSSNEALGAKEKLLEKKRMVNKPSPQPVLPTKPAEVKWIKDQYEADPADKEISLNESEPLSEKLKARSLLIIQLAETDQGSVSQEALQTIFEGCQSIELTTYPVNGSLLRTFDQMAMAYARILRQLPVNEVEKMSASPLFAIAFNFLAEYSQFPKLQAFSSKFISGKRNLNSLMGTFCSLDDQEIAALYTRANLAGQRLIDRQFKEALEIESGVSYHNDRDRFKTAANESINFLRSSKNGFEDFRITKIARSGATSNVVLMETDNEAVAIKVFKPQAYFERHISGNLDSINFTVANAEAYAMSVPSLRPYFFTHGDPIYKASQGYKGEFFNFEVGKVDRIALKQYRVYDDFDGMVNPDKRYANVVPVEKYLQKHPDQALTIINDLLKFQQLAAKERLSMGIDYKTDSIFLERDSDGELHLKISDAGDFYPPLHTTESTRTDFSELIRMNRFLMDPLLEFAGVEKPDDRHLTFLAFGVPMNFRREVESWTPEVKDQAAACFMRLKEIRPDVFSFLLRLYASASPTSYTDYYSNNASGPGMGLKEGGPDIDYSAIRRDGRFNSELRNVEAGFSSLGEISIALKKLMST